MTSKRRPIFFLNSSVILWSALVALLAVTPGMPGVQAQNPHANTHALQALQKQVLPLFELNGVVFTAPNYASGRLVVGVVDRGVEDLVRDKLSSLGVPFQSVEVIETEPIYQVSTLTDKIRPVVAGVQIRFTNYLCSLGFNAILNSVSGYVTASHCSTKQGQVDGTNYYQPLDQIADEFIGTEIADPAFFRGGLCPKGRKCRYSDSNFSDGNNAVSFTLGGIAETTGPNNGSLEISGTFTIHDDGAATVGQTINKVGRTTGWTQGTLSYDCANVGVSGTNIVLLCQGIVDARRLQIVGAGDSGSPVFRVNSNKTITLLGNLWGGNSSGTEFVYSPIANIEQELGTLTTH